MDDNFRKGYEETIMLTEMSYGISLSLSEKILFKHYLKNAQETCELKKRRKEITGYQIGEAFYMWLENYGISCGDVESFGDMPQFKEYVRRVREECFLI
jgi:hypothetical protein